MQKDQKAWLNGVTPAIRTNLGLMACPSGEIVVEKIWTWKSRNLPGHPWFSWPVSAIRFTIDRWPGEATRQPGVPLSRSQRPGSPCSAAALFCVLSYWYWWPEEGGLGSQDQAKLRCDHAISGRNDPHAAVSFTSAAMAHCYTPDPMSIWSDDLRNRYVSALGLLAAL